MTNMMTALVKARPEPGLWMEEVPVPEPGPTDVLIRVAKTAICGTDVHIWNWDAWAARTVPVPMVVGHEFSGRIADTGAAVTRFRRGERVSGEGHIVCGFCRNCRAGRGHLCRNTLGVGVNRPGSFAEYLCIPERNVVPIPDDIPDEIAAIFDPFGNAVHTALSFDLVGEDVLVTGAGPIGIMGALVAKRAGARKVVDHRHQPRAPRARPPHGRRLRRRRLARGPRRRDAGHRHARGLRHRPRDVRRRAGLPRHDRQDEQRRQDRHARHRPRRLRIDWNKVIFKMLTLKGIYGREMFETWYKMIALVQSGLDVTPAHHPPPPHIGLRVRLRRHALRRLRQGGAGLGRDGLTAPAFRFSRTGARLPGRVPTCARRRTLVRSLCVVYICNMQQGYPQLLGSGFGEHVPGSSGRIVSRSIPHSRCGRLRCGSA